MAANVIPACMRMRKLGKGQSVLFCVPPDIQSKVIQQRGDPEISTPIGVSDILNWSISETCADLERCVALWEIQGRRFAHQEYLWKGYSSPTRQWAETFLEHEARDIDSLYRPGHRPTITCCEKHTEHDGVQEIARHVAKFGKLDTNSTALQEEQERELSPEMERERQIEKPKSATPAQHVLDQEVVCFVRTGTMRDPSAFLPAFLTLGQTTAAAYLADLGEFPSNLLVTKDFARTIKIVSVGDNYKLDQYLRAVQWVVTSTGGGGRGIVQQMVIISPFEAQNLVETINLYKKVVLHLYAPRSLLGFKPLDNLLLYTIPAVPQHWRVPQLLTIQLNLFSGQLYFSSFDEYKAVCEMLGLDWNGGGQGGHVRTDGFVEPMFRCADSQAGCTFRHSPVGFLKVFLSKVRRDCKSIDKTHMGKLLNAVLLREEDI